MKLNKLRAELASVRRASLAASRRGDYMRVARLTSRAAALNSEIFTLENCMSSADAADYARIAEGKPLSGGR